MKKYTFDCKDFVTSWSVITKTLNAKLYSGKVAALVLNDADKSATLYMGDTNTMAKVALDKEYTHSTAADFTADNGTSTIILNRDDVDSFVKNIGKKPVGNIAFTIDTVTVQGDKVATEVTTTVMGYNGMSGTFKLEYFHNLEDIIAYMGNKEGKSDVATIKAFDLADAISNVKVIKCKETNFPAYLNTCFMRALLNKMEFVATDSKRLTCAAPYCKSLNGSEIFDAILSRDQWIAIADTMKKWSKLHKTEYDVRVKSCNKWFHVEARAVEFSADNGRVAIAARCVETSFPNYKRIVPKSFATTIKIQRSELEDALKVAKMTLKEADHPCCTLILRDGMLKVYACAENTATANTIACQIEPECNKLMIGVNPNYLLDGITSLVNGTETLEIGFNDEENAIVMRNTGLKDDYYLCMPCRLAVEYVPEEYKDEILQALKEREKRFAK